MTVADRLNLVVYGANGFTARQLMRYLSRRGESAWAVAGRRPEVIEQLPERPPDVPVIAAALDDPVALRRLTERTRVVLNLAGPYEPHAELLIEACIQTGTHYADISGEIAFTRGLVDRHHDAAIDAGVTVVPHCGYESLPFDLLTARLHRRFRAADGSALQAIEIAARFTQTVHPLRTGLGLSGGTVATTLAFARPIGGGRLVDPFALVPRPPTPPGVDNELDLRARRNPHTGGWLAPLAPAPFVNPAVVHRTNHLADDPYASGFTYREAFDVSATLERLPWAAGPAARGLAQTARSIVALSEGSGGPADRLRLRLLQALGPRPGSGPRPLALDTVGYRLDVLARSDSGSVATGWLIGDGNPGYRSTPNMLAEAGLALARGATRRTGVLTPAIAFGDEFLDQLKCAGVTLGAV